MILEYGFKNFFSFRDGVSLSFRLDANCPTSISQGRAFTPVLCVKGSNSSGKTHVLRALSFLSSFCTKSFAKEPDAKIAVSPFFESTEPCEFYIEFELDSGLYRYELVTTQDGVLSEVIYRTVKKRVTLLQRTKNEISYAAKKLNKLTTIKMRTNASVISVAHQYELSELDEIYEFFRSVITNVRYSGMAEPTRSMSAVSEFLQKHGEVFDFVKSFVMECDVGIGDITIESEDVGESHDAKKRKEFFPRFIHPVGDQAYPVDLDTESAGTKALFRNLALYRLTLGWGGVLVLDEFDVHLHPHILPKLINLFLDAATNTKGAQLVVSTHDSEVLNLLGRYRTYLVNKVDNESFGYRLDEIPGDILRNDRPILPAYNDGKIGGVPRI